MIHFLYNPIFYLTIYSGVLFAEGDAHKRQVHIRGYCVSYFVLMFNIVLIATCHGARFVTSKRGVLYTRDHD